METPTNHSDAAIVQGIIAMAHHLGLTVVAEGTEERESGAAWLRLAARILLRQAHAVDLMALQDVLPAGAR